MKRQKLKKSSKKWLVFFPALFVAFKYALKKQDMSTETQEQAIYFDYKKQLFLVEPKGRELLSKPTLLFYTKCKDTFQKFYTTVFSKEYNNPENFKKPVTKKFMQQCMDKWLTDNSIHKIPVVS